MPVTINGTTGIVSPNFIGNGSVPTGSVYHFATSTAPIGFLFCNGNTVPNGNGTVQGVTADFSALFAILGTTYGSAGTLPDLRGYFIRGNGTNNDGTLSGAFGAKQTDNTGPHTHGFDDYYQSSSLTKTNDNDRADAATIRMVNVNIVETGFTTPNNTNSQTPAGTTETRPKNIALLPCIKY